MFSLLLIARLCVAVYPACNSSLSKLLIIIPARSFLLLRSRSSS